jgi:hypothetical protein
MTASGREYSLAVGGSIIRCIRPIEVIDAEIVTVLKSFAPTWIISSSRRGRAYCGIRPVDKTFRRSLRHSTKLLRQLPNPRSISPMLRLQQLNSRSVLGSVSYLRKQL